MIGLGCIIFVVGMAVALIGLRGRVVGDDPYCRACGFNLRGRDASVESPRCSECGAELTDTRRAIRVGVRQRRWRWLAPGLVLTLSAAGMLGVVGWRYFTNYNLAPWKTTAWLFNDLDAAIPLDRTRAADELKKRIANASYSQMKIDWLMDQLIARQCDLKKSDNPLIPGLIDAAAQANRIDDERLKTFVRRAVVMHLSLKPKLHLFQRIKLTLEFSARRTGMRQYSLQGSPLLIDQTVWRADWLRHTVSGGSLNASVMWGSGTPPLGPQAPKFLSELEGPLGKHTVQSTVTLSTAFGPRAIDLTLPVSSDVEIFPAATPIDTFTADPAQRDKMRGAFEAARIISIANRPDPAPRDNMHRAFDAAKLVPAANIGEVRILVDPLPNAIAMDVVLTQAGKEYPAGHFLLDANKPARWNRVFCAGSRVKGDGPMDIHLRPTQQAADDTLAVGSYWGEVIVIPNIVIDAPYAPKFVHDPSLRPLIENALTGRIQRKTPGKIVVTVVYKALPVKLQCLMSLRWQGREYHLGEYESLWDAQPNRAGGYGRELPEPVAGGAASAYDIILRPDPEWELHSYNGMTPPWDGEIVLQNVPVK